ncbi:hypothetical protein [Sinomonas susongensis]|uniref:hypothetical protein n=1 Tax=Sinomonas susongensis TaxID=1324851 RepID=UPI001109AEA4|nr:hypothetical protein [Sinomonas susongensis]
MSKFPWTMTFRNGAQSEQHRLEHTQPIEAETLEDAKEIASRKIDETDPMPIHAVIYDPKAVGKILSDWDRLTNWTDHQ